MTPKYVDIEVKEDTLAMLEKIMIDNNIKDTDDTIKFLLGKYIEES